MNISLYKTDDPKQACIFVYIVASPELRVDVNFWNDYEEDHMLIFMGNQILNDTRAMIVVENFGQRSYREKFDLSVYYDIPEYDKNSWQNYSKLIELQPRRFLYYLETSLDGYNESDIEFLKEIQSTCTSLESAKCWINLFETLESESAHMSREFQQIRTGVVKNSIFTLLLPSQKYFQQRFYESLLYGSIPVVLDENAFLPFQDLIDWRTAAIRLSLDSLEEISEILRLIPQIEIMEMRRKGRFYLENYLVLTRSILSSIRFRRNLWSPVKLDVDSVVLRHILATNVLATIQSQVSDEDRRIGPYFQQYISWNIDPTHLETDYVSPMKAIASVQKTLSSNSTLGPKNLSDCYTILILAYKRDEQLKITLQSLRNFTSLDRIIIVWNDFTRDPPPDSFWDPLDVDIFVINGTKNSLNNRFIPWDLIRTDAVFSMDEDFGATNENMMLWKENKDRLVGPYFRYGTVENNKGMYIGAGLRKCDYNLVLTGAAFMHKSYFYSYTYWMPEIIREMVHNLTNCEDIAMNFMISHISRRPPVKATPMIDAKGPKHGSLHSRGSHYNNRAKCIKAFVEVYGYNPLIDTEFKVESAHRKFSDCLAK